MIIIEQAKEIKINSTWMTRIGKGLVEERCYTYSGFQPGPMILLRPKDRADNPQLKFELAWQEYHETGGSNQATNKSTKRMLVELVADRGQIRAGNVWERTLHGEEIEAEPIKLKDISRLKALDAISRNFEDKQFE